MGHHFGEPGWLAWAVRPGPQRRRLAQLGDAVLESAAATGLFRAHPYAAEGELSERRRTIVTNHRLTAFGARVGLGPVGDGVGHHRAHRGRRTRDVERDAGDSVQALLGAVVMDADLAAGLAAGWQVLGLDHSAAPAAHPARAATATRTDRPPSVEP